MDRILKVTFIFLLGALIGLMVGRDLWYEPRVPQYHGVEPAVRWVEV